MAEENIILPNGYTKLDWIAGDGASYLELPIKSNRGDKLVLETNCRFFSLDNQAEAKNGNPYFFFGIKSGVWYCGAGTTSSSSVKADTDWHKIKLIHSAEDTGLYLDGTKILSQTYSPDGVVLGQLIALFKTWNGTYFAKNCKKDWKIYINDELIFDLIPCRDGDNVPCMYDLVTKQTFYNQGGGTLLTPDDFIEDYPQTNLYYNLPADYKKCLYLQSDGTQWINTGVVPDNETGMYFRGMQLSYGNFVPFGVEQNGYTIYPPRYNNADLYYKWGNASYKMMTHDKAGDYIFASYLNFYNSKIAKFISEDTNAIMPIQQAGTFTIPIWIFTYNVNNSFNTTYGKWVGRIYRAKITQGDTLIHDFVPCLDADNRPCMYDLITQETYYNQSGGTEFTYCVEHQLPSDFVKLKYLESDGTQFIKTGYVPTNTTGLYIEAYNTVGGDFVPMGCRNDTGNTRFFIGRVTKTNAAGFGWGACTSTGGTGDCRYEATLNWLNDRKSIINAPAFAQRVNSLGTLSFTPLYGINLFGVNQNGSNVLNWKGRIYRAKISEGGEIVRDFVPTYDSRLLKPCMYDLINNVAYYNDGKGEFIYNRDFEGTYKGYTGLGCVGNKLGSDYDPINEKLPSGYTRIDFLESNGSGGINTGLSPTGLNFKLKFTAFNGSGSGLMVLGTENIGKFWYGVITQNNNNGLGFYTYVPNISSGNVGAITFDNEPGTISYAECNFREGYIKMTAEYTTIKTGIVDYTEGKGLSNVWMFSRQGGGIPSISRVYEFEADYDGVSAAKYIPSIDNDGVPCMYDLVTQTPFYMSYATLKAGLKTISHALQLYLPDSGGSILLSLPTNDKTEIYEEKIRANNPNWEITFYYH